MNFVWHFLAPVITLTIYALSVWLVELEPTTSSILLAILVGLSFESIRLQLKQNKDTKKIINTNKITIEIFKDEESRKLEVERMYKSSADKITSSHLYSGDYKVPEDDIGLKLSIKDNTAVHRIIAINSSEHKLWMQKMYKNRPENYFIKIIENLPKEPPYPNFVLTEKDGVTKLFIVFSSGSNEGSFAFTTTNNKLSDGMRGYIDHIYSEALSIEHYLDK